MASPWMRGMREGRGGKGAEVNLAGAARRELENADASEAKVLDGDVVHTVVQEELHVAPLTSGTRPPRPKRRAGAGAVEAREGVEPDPACRRSSPEARPSSPRASLPSSPCMDGARIWVHASQIWVHARRARRGGEGRRGRRRPVWCEVWGSREQG
jgi:hypothetical protein